nr:delta-1-pyrroline-5-carboxylate reductase apf3 [Quercus suber]
MELLVDAAVRRGIPQDMASVLVKQSAYGSSVLAKASNTSLHALRKDVCVPGGSTQKAIDRLYQRGLDDIVDSAVECSLTANRAMGTNLN